MAPIRITSGPSKWDMMMSLFERKKVEFTFADGKKILLELRTLGNDSNWDPVHDAIDDIDDVWLLEGEFPGEDRGPYTVLYAVYSPIHRTGIAYLDPEDARTERGRYEILRYEWGRRIRGENAISPA